MSFNLIDAAKALFSNEYIGKASSFLGETEGGVNKAMSGIIPSFLSGIVDKASNTTGAANIANMARDADKAGYQSLGSLFDTDRNNLISKGSSMLSGLFGDGKTNLFSDLISRFSGVKSSSATSLLSMAAPAIMGLLGRHFSSNNMDAPGILSFFNSQKANVQNAIPPGLNLGNIFGPGMASRETEPHVVHRTEAVEETSGGGGMKMLLPILLLVALGAAALYLFRDGCNKEKEMVVTTTDTVVDQTEPDHTSVTTHIAGSVDTVSGDFIYDLGETVTIDLPDGKKLTVGRNSTEYKLVTFLMDKNAILDTAKGNWFEFTGVRFSVGGAEITATSTDQLKNLVTISNAFPAAQFKVGGYTDNTGDATANLTLSQKRADAVVATLKKLGMAAGAIEKAKGYGQEWPIADNATVEGRAQNRRVAVNVKAK